MQGVSVRIKWDANELFSFLRIFDDSSAWKRRHAAEPLLSEVDNLSLLRLAWLVNATSIDKLRNIVLDGDARELIARAISAMSDAADLHKNEEVHNATILVTGRSLQEGASIRPCAFDRQSRATYKGHVTP